MKTTEKYFEYLIALKCEIEIGKRIVFSKIGSVDDRMRGVLIEKKIIEKTKGYFFKWIADNPSIEMAEDVKREIRKKRIKQHNPLRRRKEQHDRIFGYFD